MKRNTRVLVSGASLGMGLGLMIIGVGLGFLHAWDGGGSLALGLTIVFVGFGLIMLGTRMIYVIEVEDKAQAKRLHEASLNWVRTQMTSRRK